MAVRRWKIAQSNKELSRRIAEQYNIPRFAAHLLVSRGITEEKDILSAIDPLSVPISDPFLLKDMQKAAARIEKAIDKFERILIYGDYDVDGISATTLLYSYLCSRGADVLYMLPTRDDGYGLNIDAIDRIKETGTKLLVTVDNGISAADEIEYANTLGIETVITDHHKPPKKLPNAVAIVDPHRKDETAPFRDYAGVGVAFMLACALEGDAEKISELYADLAALGTIADVVPLKGENRAIAAKGMEQINVRPRPGLEALMKVSLLGSHRVTATDIAYIITPRLNSAGRLGSPDRAVQLMLVQNMEDGKEQARELQNENARRHELEREMASKAWKLVDKNPSLIHDRVVVICGEGWNHGILGIFAARLCDQLGKPAVVLSSDGELVKGSGRSLGGFSLHDAFAACSEHLIAYGGHTLAAGLQLKAENVDAFRIAINEYARNCGEMPIPELLADCELRADTLDVSLIKDSQILEPFGAQNPAPLVLVRNLKLKEIYPCGGNLHHKLTFEQNGCILTAMYFNMAKQFFPFIIGDKLDCVFSLDSDSYGGRDNLKLIIRDARLSALDTEAFIAAQRLYEKLLRDEDLSEAETGRLTPSREDFAHFYRYIDHVKYKGGTDTLAVRACTNGLSYERMLVILDVFAERGLVELWKRDAMCSVKAAYVTEKTNLEESLLMRRLRSSAERKG